MKKFISAITLIAGIGWLPMTTHAAIITNTTVTGTETLAGNFAPLATATGTNIYSGVASNVNDTNFDTYIGHYNSFPYTVTLTWSEAKTIDTVWFTMGRVAAWDLLGPGDSLIGSGTFNSTSQKTQKLTIDPISVTSLKLRVNGRYSSSGGQIAATYEIQTVPEPASLALLSFGGLMLLRRRR